MCAVVLSIFLIAPVSLLAVCDPQFGSQTDMGVIDCAEIDEASGIAASRLNPNVYWVHNDSGDPNRIFAVNGQGQCLGVFYIDGFAARDWEDIAVGPGPVDGVNYIYIGNIGDNYAQYQYKYVARIPEPLVDENQNAVTQTLYGAETIVLELPDQKRDTETVMVDPWNRDLYLVSKRESNVNVYRAAWPQATNGVPITMELVTTLTVGWLVGGDISPSGNQILIKHGSYVYHWCRAAGQTVGDALSVAPTIVPYVPEQQGEAICWTADESGYYTLSEGHDEHMFFYPSLADTVIPEVDIADPAPGGMYETTNSDLTVIGTACDNVGVEKVTFEMTGATACSGLCDTVEAVLVPEGSDWRYMDNGSDQGTAWREPSFDDSSWPGGTAELGYGDGDETTVVSYGGDAGNKYITTYFRRVFQLESAEPYAVPLALRVRRDDGVVVYLNGEEVFRDSMPSGEITYLTAATVSVQGEEEEIYQSATIDGALLTAGVNVIAVEIHQFSGGSSDISFNLSLGLPGGDLNWSTPQVVLQPGVTTVKVTAEDLAGNKESEQIDVHFIVEDSDGDGLMDEWEETYFGGLQNDGGLDSDQDGHTDLQEYYAGTVPTNSASVLRIPDVTVNGDGLTVKWQSSEGRTYNLLRSSDLTKGFVPIAVALAATPPQNSYTDNNVPGPSSYYMIQLEGWE